MANISVAHIISEVQLLSVDQRRELLDQLQSLVLSADDEPPPRITDLEGLGAEIWQGIDVQAYIEQERDAWDG